jgi:hypothetical protein
MWKLSNKEPEYLKTIEALSLGDIDEIPNGNGKAKFIPMMNEEERDDYIRDNEPFWKKINKKLNDMVK